MRNASFLWLWHHSVYPPGQAGTQHCRWRPEQGDLQPPHPAYQVPPLLFPVPLEVASFWRPPWPSVLSTAVPTEPALCLAHTTYSGVLVREGVRLLGGPGRRAGGVGRGQGATVARGVGSRPPSSWPPGPSLTFPLSVRDPSLCGARRQAASPVLEKGREAHQLRELTARVSGFSIDWLP